MMHIFQRWYKVATKNREKNLFHIHLFLSDIGHWCGQRWGYTCLKETGVAPMHYLQVPDGWHQCLWARGLQRDLGLQNRSPPLPWRPFRRICFYHPSITCFQLLSFVFSLWFNGFNQVSLSFFCSVYIIQIW